MMHSSHRSLVRTLLAILAVSILLCVPVQILSATAHGGHGGHSLGEAAFSHFTDMTAVTFALSMALYVALAAAVAVLFLNGRLALPQQEAIRLYVRRSLVDRRRQSPLQALLSDGIVHPKTF